MFDREEQRDFLKSLYAVFEFDDVTECYWVKCFCNGCQEQIELRSVDLSRLRDKSKNKKIELFCVRHRYLYYKKGSEVNAVRVKKSLMSKWDIFVRKLHRYCDLFGERGDIVIHQIGIGLGDLYKPLVVENGFPMLREESESFYKIYGKMGRGSVDQLRRFLRLKYLRCEDLYEEFLNLSSKYHIRLIKSSENTINLQKESRDLYRNGIRFIPLFPSELDDRVLSRLRYIVDYEGFRFGRVYLNARDLRVVFVHGRDKELAGQVRRFLNENHIDGSPSYFRYAVVLCDKNTGLFCSVMTFCTPSLRSGVNKSRFSDSDLSNAFELSHFASLNDHTVRGAFSRLFSHFVDEVNPSFIISFADVRFSSFNPDGTVFTRLGFRYSHTTRPSYKYSSDGGETMLNKGKFSLKSCRKLYKSGVLKEWREDWTEREIMKENGYERWYDCGKHVFIWESKGKNIRCHKIVDDIKFLDKLRDIAIRDRVLDRILAPMTPEEKRGERLDNVLNEFMLRGLKVSKEVLDVEFENQDSLITCKCRCGKECKKSLRSIRRSDQSYCSSSCCDKVVWNRMSEGKIREFVKGLGLELVFFDDYKDKDSLLTLKCGCGEEFKRSYQVLSYANRYNKGRVVCDNCLRKRLSEEQRLDINTLLDRFNDLGIVCLNIDEYKNRESRLRFKCMKCGMEFEEKVFRVFSVGCRLCCR